MPVEHLKEALRAWGPVFVQGDHYQFNAAKYRADPDSVTEDLELSTRLSVHGRHVTLAPEALLVNCMA